MPRSHHKLSWPFRIATALALATIALLAYYILYPQLYPGTKAIHRIGPTPTSAIKVALETFKLDNARYPTTPEGLTPLITQPPNTPHWQKLLDEIPLDDWHHPFHYLQPGLQNPDGYDLRSDGPDGKPNTPDDITNYPNNAVP